jgi:MFS family permease
VQEDSVSSQAQRKNQAGVSRLVLAFVGTQYGWLWCNSAFSSMGMAVRMLTQGWLVLIMTDSPFWVGLVVGLQGVGLVGFGVFGGVLVDKLDRRVMLTFVQLATGTTALAVGLLAVTGNIVLWHMLVAAFVQGLLQAVQMPASNALIYQVVGPGKLLNAMAARLMVFNMTRIIGSLIAGWLITHISIGSCYLFSAGSSYLAAPLLMALRGSYRPETTRESFWQVLSGGIRYAWSSASIRMLLLMSLLMELYGFSHMVMLPVMARDVLHVGAEGLGALSAAGGAGAMLSTIVVAGLGDFKNKGLLLLVTAAGAGVFILLFAASPWYLASMVLVAGVGASLMAYDATMGTLLQLLSTDAVRGRMMGLYGLTFGFTPVGGFLAGAIGTLISVPFAVGLGGAIILAYVAGTARRVLALRTLSKPSDKQKARLE